MSKKMLLEAQGFSRFPELIHGFGTKETGVDLGSLAHDLRLSEGQIYHLNQTHSGDVVFLDGQPCAQGLPDADALVTEKKNIIIGVKTADCLPVLVYDPQKEVVAAVHAGYRGLLKKIIQNTFSLMKARLDCKPKDFFVALGPCICVDHYEVGEEVISEFKRVFNDRFICEKYQDGKFHLDIKGTAQWILKDCGVCENNIFSLNLCTYEDSTLFHSYRRERDTSGRQFSFIGMVHALSADERSYFLDLF